MDERYEIMIAAKEYVAALEHLAAVRQSMRTTHFECREFVVQGQTKVIGMRYDAEIREARQRRKRTLARLKRAVASLRPLPGQLPLFEELAKQ